MKTPRRRSEQTNGKESVINNLDRKIEGNLEKQKTWPSGMISNDGSGPAQLEGLVPMSHHNTEFRTLYKVGLANYGQEKKELIAEKEI